MLDAVAPPDASDDRGFFREVIGRNKDGDRLADDVFRQIAKELLRSPVPVNNPARKFPDEDGVGCLFQQVRLSLYGVFGSSALHDFLLQLFVRALESCRSLPNANFELVTGLPQ